MNDLVDKFLTAGLKHKCVTATSDPWKHYTVVKETVKAYQNVRTCVRVKERAFVHPGIASVTHAFARKAHAS